MNIIRVERAETLEHAQRRKVTLEELNYRQVEIVQEASVTTAEIKMEDGMLNASSEDSRWWEKPSVLVVAIP